MKGNDNLGDKYQKVGDGEEGDKPSTRMLAIQGLVNQLMSMYDHDDGGELSKKEFKHFIEDTIGNFGSKGKDEMGEKFSYSTFTNEGFEQLFEDMDTDHNGTVDKDELVAFIDEMIAPKNFDPLE